jgi:pilus assembly protein CpaF
MDQEHVVRLEKRPPNIEGKGEVPIRQLVINALRMRPDRIVVGECRGGEALDMLQAMNTGHDGSMTTVHSNSPRDTLRRIETMVLMAGMELPLKAIREQVASAIELIVHMERVKDGTRKVVQGLRGTGHGKRYDRHARPVYLQAIRDSRMGSSEVKLKSTGLRPHFMEKITNSNIQLPDSIFEK